MGNHDGDRSPLYFAEAGYDLDIGTNVFSVATDTGGATYSGYAKNGGPSYVDFMPVGRNDFLCVYSVAKEEIKATRFSLPYRFP